MANKKKPAKYTLIEKRKRRQAKRAAKQQADSRRHELTSKAS